MCVLIRRLTFDYWVVWLVLLGPVGGLRAFSPRLLPWDHYSPKSSMLSRPQWGTCALVYFNAACIFRLFGVRLSVCVDVLEKQSSVSVCLPKEVIKLRSGKVCLLKCSVKQQLQSWKYFIVKAGTIWHLYLSKWGRFVNVFQLQGWLSYSSVWSNTLMQKLHLCISQICQY